MSNLVISPWGKFQHFIGSLLLFIILPLVPILIELLFYSVIKPQHLYLSTTMFAASVGVSSREFFIFSVGIAMSLFFAFALGGLPTFETNGRFSKDTINYIGYICLGFMALLQILERLNLHLVKGVRAVNF